MLMCNSEKKLQPRFILSSGIARTFGLLLTVTYAVLLPAAAPAEPRWSATNPSLDCRISRQAPVAASLFLPANLADDSAGLATCQDNRPGFVHAGQPPVGESKNRSDKATAQAKSPIGEHHFWDRQNGLLFAAVGASRALDYFSTLNFRRRGRDEGLLTNDIVDNHPAFAAIEVGAIAVSVGASYIFHHYHHHRLERWTSIVHASLATGGAIRNYSLKTAH
jgi:hypothetical protein